MFEPAFRLIKKKKFSFQQNIDALNVFEVFLEVINDIFDDSFKLKPLSFRKGVLRVKTNNSVLAQELQIRKDEILKSLNKKLSSAEVKEILFEL